MFIEAAPVAKKENVYNIEITSDFDHDLYWNHHPERTALIFPVDSIIN